MEPQDDHERRDRELAYYRRQADELAGENVRLDYTLSALRYDLKQRRQGYALLASLQKVSGVEQEEGEVYTAVCASIVAELGMERAVVLTPAVSPDSFQVASEPSGPIVRFPPEVGAGTESLLVTKATAPTPIIEQARAVLALPYFVAVPITASGTVLGLLVAGRLQEALPFSPPLDEGDVDTLRVVAGLLAATKRDRQFAALRAEHERRAIEVEKAREVSRAYAQLEASHRELKATQAQLVHQEKLASLGRLTAGVAHEIKNPLNFVNNFALLSRDLIDELREELVAAAERPVREALAGLDPILDDLRFNVEKIALHGRRADAIVRAMLLHARGSTGNPEPTSLPVLLDETIALARSGHPDCPCVARSYDPTIESVDVVRQALGRAILNLLENAFSAVRERQASGEAGYQPCVSLSTECDEGTVRIVVTDNGSGIPAALHQRIFEPFVTTKPTGQGTGLGLSLASDIVASHGGTLSVASEPGQGSVFTVALPCAAPRQE